MCITTGRVYADNEVDRRYVSSITRLTSATVLSSLDDQLIRALLLRRSLRLEPAENLQRCAPDPFHSGVPSPIWSGEASRFSCTNLREPHQMDTA